MTTIDFRERSSSDAIDVAIIGGGIAGLVAAYALRHRNIVVLESSCRPGGRICTHQFADNPVNLGAHMVPQAGSTIGDLAVTLGLTARPLPPRLFSLAYSGRHHLRTPQLLLPFAMNLSAREKIALAKMGAQLRWNAARCALAARRTNLVDPAERREALLSFEDGRTLAVLMGYMPERVEEIFVALTERNGASPQEMSAGHGLRSFSNVWAKTAPGSNLIGGTATLPEALANILGKRFKRGHTALTVTTNSASGVRITYRSDSGESQIAARHCILATPAPVTRRITTGLPAAKERALDQIRYGAFLSLGVSLVPGTPLPWDGTYAIATPGMPFSTLFNHDACRPDSAISAGFHSVMLFAGAANAQATLRKSDDEIAALWLDALHRSFPQTQGRVTGWAVGRWPLGAPYSFPGRALLQPELETFEAPLALAGDYIEFPNMEAAANSGLRAAQAVEGWLARCPHSKAAEDLAL